jgi:hypothetical protein
MSNHNHIDINNAAESSVISALLTFVWTILMPWALHTVGTLLSAAFVAFCIYHFNKWLKAHDEKKEALKKAKELEDQKKRQDSIKVIV